MYLNPRRLFHRLLFAALFAIISNPPEAIAAGRITLAWDPSPDPGVIGYRVLVGNSPGIFTWAVETGPTTSATIADLVEGNSYVFAAISYNAQGLESIPSNELACIVHADDSGSGPSTRGPGGNLVNVSTRAWGGTGENAVIAGITILGDAPKRIAIRAIGPSLLRDGLRDAMADPSLSLYDDTGTLIVSSTNWQHYLSDLKASGLAPGSESEAAIVITLDPGVYTVVLYDENYGPGIALVELYDLTPYWSRIGGISTRGEINTGDKVMIAGFFLQGSETATVVVRALGPSLINYGIDRALADPTLQLYNGDGSLICANDNWRSDQADAVRSTTLAPLNEEESVILIALAPGHYSAIVRGENDARGVGLVEVYHLQQLELIHTVSAFAKGSPDPRH